MGRITSNPINTSKHSEMRMLIKNIIFAVVVLSVASVGADNGCSLPLPPRRNGSGNLGPMTTWSPDGVYVGKTDNSCNGYGKDTNECQLVKGYRISCTSDTYDPNHDYVGVVVYGGLDRYNKNKKHGRVFPGYVMIYRTDDITRAKYGRSSGRSHEGEVHGYAVYRKFRQQPSYMYRKYGMTFTGFSVRSGRAKFNSGSLNAAEYWFHKKRAMQKSEQCQVQAVIDVWKQKGPATSVYVDKKIIYSKPGALDLRCYCDSCCRQKYRLPSD